MDQIFPYGKPVSGTDLIDRKEIVKKIIYEVRGQQSVILTAPRRYGKSSVIKEVLAQVKSPKEMMGYIDLFEHTTERELAQAIVEITLSNSRIDVKQMFKEMKQNFTSFLKSLTFKHIWQEHEFILSFADPANNDPILLSEALDFPEKYAQAKKKKMILAIDEFGEFKYWDQPLIKKMRAKMQRHTHVTYIFSGSQESVIRDMFTKKNYAFYGFGKLLNLDPLPEKDLTEYLQAKLSKLNFNINAATLKQIGSLTSFHPHYTKILAQAVIEQAPKNKLITADIVQKAYARAYFMVKGEVEYEWEGLSRSRLQRQVLKYLAYENTGIFSKMALPQVDKSKINFAISELQNKGIIIKIDRGHYIFSNPFFPAFLQEASIHSV